MALVKSHIFTTIRGVTGDLEFRLRKNRKTDLSKKRFPSNPRTDAQQAVRLCYGKGVQAYNQLTPEQIETWNEIGKSYSPPLDAYRAFMKDYIPTCLAPQEQTEEQAQHNSELGTQYHLYSGQRLTISNRKVSKLAFWLRKQGSPVGDVFLQILKVSDDSIIVSKKWGNATDLPSVEAELKEVEYDSPVLINEEVRILSFFDGSLSTSNYVVTRYQNTDVKANEYATRGEPPDWIPIPTGDTAYRYQYYEA